jgi:hypothetical protein
VHLVEVDPVGAQAAQRRLDRTFHVSPRAARAEVRAVRALHVDAELRGDDRVVTSAGQCLTKEFFAATPRRAVDVGDIEQVYPGVDRGCDQCAGAGERLRSGTRPAEVVAPQPDRTDHQPGLTQVTEFHGDTLLRVVAAI